MGASVNFSSSLKKKRSVVVFLIYSPPFLFT